MTAAIEIHGLTKLYGKRPAVSDVSLDVREGEVFGYLGPNGAGKTTTIRVLLDLLRPTRGRATVLGLDTRRESQEIRRRVGYVSGEGAMYERLTGAELLRYAAHLRGGVDWGYVHQLSERLECDLSPRIRSLSRGNRQKVAILVGLMHRPDLVIVDEPTTGLDPLVQNEFRRLVEEIRAEGRTVFISSHFLAEVDRLCDRVGIIRRGTLVAVEDVHVLKERAVHEIEFEFGEPAPPEAFADLPGVRDVRVEGDRVRCTVVGKPDALIKAAARFEVVRVISHEPSLEDVFLSYYDEAGEDAP